MTKHHPSRIPADDPALTHVRWLDDAWRTRRALTDDPDTLRALIRDARYHAAMLGEAWPVDIPDGMPSSPLVDALRAGRIAAAQTASSEIVAAAMLRLGVAEREQARLEARTAAEAARDERQQMAERAEAQAQAWDDVCEARAAARKGRTNNPDGPPVRRWMTRVGETLVVAIGDADEQRGTVVETTRDGWAHVRLDDGRILRMSVANAVPPRPHRRKNADKPDVTAPPA